MSDARAPAMDVHMIPQDTGMARSFWLILSALLIEDDGYPNDQILHSATLHPTDRATCVHPNGYYRRS